LNSISNLFYVWILRLISAKPTSPVTKSAAVAGIGMGFGPNSNTALSDLPAGKLIPCKLKERFMPFSSLVI